MALPLTHVIPSSACSLYDLTIVTVCRNVLPQLKRTTASVLGQKAVYSNVSIEHVIVDGASTDGTPEWLAEMWAQGKIETYISEPDCGIYDAMNKGINMARGAVILFINADDTLELVDLAPCVTPILRGETKLAGAITRVVNDQYLKLSFYCPDERLLYLYGPVHHQAFFAQTQFIREIGGYNSKAFRCHGDTDFMCRAIAKAGWPRITGQTVSNMPAGGFSSGGFYRFCDEYINVMYSFRGRIVEKCQSSVEYHELITAALLNHCVSMQYMLKKDKAIETRMLEQMLELTTRVMVCGPCSIREKLVLAYLRRGYVPSFLRHGRITALHKMGIRLCTRFFSLPANHPYSGILRIHTTPSFLASARHLLTKGFKRSSPQQPLKSMAK